jgi:hypothetical protein
MARAFSIVIAALFALAAEACAERKTEPEEVLKSFIASVRAHRADQAWSLLSESSRKELETRHQELAKAAKKTGAAAKATPEEMLYDELGLVTLNPSESIAVVSPPGREVTLRVSVKDGRSAEIRMLREDSGWKVDLFGSLKKAPPLDLDLKGKPAETSTVP